MRQLPTYPLALMTVLTVALPISVGIAQTSSGQSDYIFRFNTGVSSVFLNTMTFASQQSLDLGSCTTTEKINGPLSCAVNCQNDSVCLLQVSGPSGSSVSDVLEKVSESPISSASPGPSGSPSPSPSASPSVSFLNSPSALGSWIQRPASDGSDVSGRIQAYNLPSR